MSTQAQIEAYIADQPRPKREALKQLHGLVLRLSPESRLWFLDGRNGEGKVVANPNIGYGTRTMTYADGGSREFYRVGLSANTTGISVYVMGVEDRKYLAEAFGKRLGKASITGYCVKFRTLDDIDMDVLEEVLRFGLGPPS